MRTASSTTYLHPNDSPSQPPAEASWACCCCPEKHTMFDAHYNDINQGHIPHHAGLGDFDAHLGCEEFLTDCCTDDLCPEQLPESAQCTDQCVVVACDDPAHACDHNYQDCADVHCNEQNCNMTDFERIMQCCTDNHAFPIDHHPHGYAEPGSSQNWDIFADPCCPPQIPTANLQGFYPSPSAADRNAMTTEQSPTMSDFYSMPPSAPSHPAPLICMWGECSDTFSTMEELICHVNISHLRLPFHAPPDPDSPPQLQQCLWKDCHDFRNPLNLPPGVHSDLASTILTSHIVQEHLGQYITSPCEWRRRLEAQRRSTSQGIEFQMQQQQQQQQIAMAQDTMHINAVDALRLSPAESISGDSSLSSHDCETGAHKCHWKECGRNFDSCDALTDHLNQDHVGGGKSHYDCFWAGCRRNGSNGFTSKQKICRHLQSHTGHRPFECKICKQKFSEAATLQQHMRRHTQEKPYICDHPGCEKAFAITGALTIHKRTHNGEKPFKCPKCDRAFSESSNLSKHLRTHTGVRPYPCNHPGCGKAFARPDQLNRHMSVHKRKQYANATSVAQVLKV